MRTTGFSVTAIAAVVLSTSAIAAESISGPIEGVVTRVIDGDTVEFVAHVWLGLNLTTHVRVRGIDTPEVAGKCAAEKTRAAEATRRLADLTASGISIANVADDKYAGRVIADVTTATGTDVKAAMIASGLARPYDGSARQPWCEVVSASR